MKSIIFYHIKDVAYVRLRTPYLEMYKAADLRDYQRMVLEMRLDRPPFIQQVKQETNRINYQIYEQIKREAEARSHARVTTLGDLIRQQMELNSDPPYVEATDPEDVAVLGYN